MMSQRLGMFRRRLAAGTGAVFLFYAAALVAGDPAIPVQEPPAPKRLGPVNPGFETSDGPTAAGWTIRDQISRVVENPDAARSGRRFLEIKDPNEHDGSDVLSSWVPVEPGTWLAIRLFVYRVEGTPGGLGVYPRFRDREGKEAPFSRIREREARRVPQTSGEWTLAAFPVRVPDGAREMAVWLHTFSNAVGTYRVDDVEIVSCSTATVPAYVSWTGGRATLLEDGTVATVWEHGTSPSVSLGFRPPTDWSRWSALAFTRESETATNSAFMVIITSENDDTPGADYYSYKVTLDWTGSRTFVLPFRELGSARQPIGWNKIDRIAFTAAGWGNHPDPRAVVVVRRPRLVQVRTEGPTMDDPQFFAALDLARPDLEAVRRAVERRDWAAARHAFAEHIRSRVHPKWHIDWRKAPFRGVKVPPPEADRAPDQWDYFSTFFKVDWSGWKHFTLRKSDFSPKAFVEGKGWKGKKPIGWNWITYIAVNAKGWGLTPDPDTVLYFDDVGLLAPDGSKTMITDFEDQDDEGFRGLERTDERAHSGRWSGKWENMPINTGIRRMRIPHDWTGFDALDFWVWSANPTGARFVIVLDSDPPKRPKRAEEYVQKTFTWNYGGKAWTAHFDGPIDWHANPTSGPGRTHLWNEALNRHFHFRDLSSAYWNTGDERYAAALADQWMDWIRRNPPPLLSSGNRGGSTNCIWQTLTTGIRLESTWPDAFYRCLGSPHFTDDVIVTIVKSIADQARHLVRWPTSGNWLTEESMGLYTAGMLFPEYKEATVWRKTAVERLYRQLDQEVYPDGMEYELATGYNNWVVSNFTELLDRADLNGLRSELPKDYIDRLEKMYDYLLLVMMPDGRAPGLNDSGNADVRRLLQRGSKLYPERSDFLFGATLGKQGRRPEETSHAFPYSGHYVMRSDWSADALYLLFDSGPFGYGHQHEDKLHFVLFGYGRQLILDPGNYSYDRSKWRRYITGTAGHNTVMVDGQGQNRRAHPETRFWPRPWTAPVPPGNDTRWESTLRADFARGTYRCGYGPAKKSIDVVHTRRILFIKPEYFLVVDTLHPQDGRSHSYEALFHLDAESATLDAASLTVRTNEEDAANVEIRPLSQPGLTCRIVKGQEDPVQGWANHPWRAIPTAVFRREAPGIAWFAFIVTPLRPGAARSEIEAVDGGTAADARSLDLHIRFEDGRVDRVLVRDGGPENPGAASPEIEWSRTGDSASPPIRF